MVKIKNIAGTAYRYKYIIYRIVGNDNWYYGACDWVLTASEICASLCNNARICESKDAYPEDM